MIAIKNTHMPRNCSSCMFLRDYMSGVYRCRLCRPHFKAEQVVMYGEARPEWCPLVEVTDHEYKFLKDCEEELDRRILYGNKERRDE